MAKAKKKVSTKKEIEGLGDLIEKATEVTGIKKVVKAVFGDDCGCDERKEKLNKMFSFITSECLVKSEYIVLKKFFGQKPYEIKPTEWLEIVPIGRRVLGMNISNSMGCGGCVREVMTKLKQVYETYETENKK